MNPPVDVAVFDLKLTKVLTLVLHNAQTRDFSSLQESPPIQVKKMIESNGCRLEPCFRGLFWRGLLRLRIECTSLHGKHRQGPRSALTFLVHAWAKDCRGGRPAYPWRCPLFRAADGDVL